MNDEGDYFAFHASGLDGFWCVVRIVLVLVIIGFCLGRCSMGVSKSAASTPASELSA